LNSAAPNQPFDANGNLATQTDAAGTTTFTWDTRNRLVTISGPGLSASFVYDAVGRRVSKTINGVTTAYHYDNRDVLAEQGGSAVLANYLRKLCLDDAYIRQTATENEYYHTDALGSVLQLTDQAGTVQTSYAYEPFGKTSTTGTSTNPFQYTQRENDGTGLYYYRARYYAAINDRFISVDPILEPSSASGSPFGLGMRWSLPAKINAPSSFTADTLNPYAYVSNNPLNFVDPTGTDKQALNILSPISFNKGNNCRLDGDCFEACITGAAQRAMFPCLGICLPVIEFPFIFADCVVTCVGRRVGPAIPGCAAGCTRCY